MPDYTQDHSIPHPSPGDPVRGSTSDYLLTDLRDLARGADSAISTAMGTRAPLSHTHSQSDVSGLSGALDAAASTAEWDGVSDRPSTFPPAAHTHPQSDVEGLTPALAEKVATTDPRLSDARPPTAHTHPVSEVDGLAARLAALERDTGWRDITGLLENGWLADLVLIRRVGPTVYFSHNGLDGRSRTGNTMVTLPATFATRRAMVPFIHLDGVYRALVNGYGGVEPPQAIRDSAPYSYASAESMWGVPSAAWPLTLPGDPA